MSPTGATLSGMRKLGLLGVVLLALGASAGIQLNQTVVKTFTNCEAGGSAAQTLTGGDYLMTVHDESTWVCLADSASTCASLGTKFPPGFAMVITINNAGQSVSCRSAGVTGDVEFTRKGN